MTGLARYVFSMGKYDSHVLTHLAERMEASLPELLNLRNAAENFAVDTYALTERILVQLLFTGANVMEYTPLFSRYLMEGGRSDLEAAILHRCCGLYLMEGVKMEAVILQDVARAASRGETLSDMCRLACLEYYSHARDERNERTDAVLQNFGEQLIRRDMKLPLFQEYVDILEGAESMMDKTMVVYKGSPGRPVKIHYRILQAAPGSGTVPEEPMRAFDMQHMYAGIYTAAFVLFGGESLEYYITDASSENDQRLDAGELRMGEGGMIPKESRYALLNDISVGWLAGRKGEAQEQLEQYLHTEWMADGLFRPMADGGEELQAAERRSGKDASGKQESPGRGHRRGAE